MINMTQECEAGADQFLHHHENTEPFEKRFRKVVLSLTDTFNTQGNPFVEETSTLGMVSTVSVVPLSSAVPMMYRLYHNDY